MALKIVSLFRMKQALVKSFSESKNVRPHIRGGSINLDS